MAQLATVQELKDYSLTQRSPLGLPASLTDPIIGSHLTAATADLLQWAGLTEIPAASLRLDSLKERCKELATVRIDAVFFGLDTEVADSVERRIRSISESLRETEAVSARSSITPTRRFTRFTDSNELTELDP